VIFRSQLLNRRAHLIVGEICFDPPGHKLGHRIVSISFKIEGIARMVYVLLDEFCIQLVARKRFNCGMRLCLDIYMNNRNSIIEVINIYLRVDMG
jgi:hypothetical protein